MKQYKIIATDNSGVRVENETNDKIEAYTIFQTYIGAYKCEKNSNHFVITVLDTVNNVEVAKEEFVTGDWIEF